MSFIRLKSQCWQVCSLSENLRGSLLTAPGGSEHSQPLFVVSCLCLNLSASLVKRCVMVFGGYPDNPGFSILRALIIPVKTLPHKVTLPGSKELGPNSFEAAIQPTGTYYCGICLIFFFFGGHTTRHI